MANKPKVRGGLVGSGFAANLHYEGIKRVYGTDVDLAGIFSPTAANAQRFAKPRGLRTFASLEALLDGRCRARLCQPGCARGNNSGGAGTWRAHRGREAADWLVRRRHGRL
jgi:hypothetical protein